MVDKLSDCLKFDGDEIGEVPLGFYDAPKMGKVNHPSHYTQHPSGVECITITEHMSFTLGNAIKYIWRADYKNGVEDLKKAIWYLQREVEKRTEAESW